MKIAILYDVAFPFSIGGGEKINWEVARRLAARGHEVSLVSSKMWEGDDVLERDGIRYVGVCRWLDASNNLGNRSWAQPFLFAGSVFVFLLRNRFDVVASNAFPYLSTLTARVAGVFSPAWLVVTWYEARGYAAWKSYAGGWYAPFASFLEILTARVSRHHTTISAYTAGRMTSKLAIPRENIAVIPCGVDLANIKPAQPVAKEKVILYVGRLVKHKRVDSLIDAFATLSSEFPEHRLRIIGPGAELDALRARAVERRVGEKVEFLQTVVGPELYEHFRRAEVFVLPSDQEGFGMVLIEAMAAETPVIAKIADLSAASTVITHDSDGLLFTTQEELVRALRRILGSPDTAARLIAGGCETAALYDWESVIIPSFERYFANLKT